MTTDGRRLPLIESDSRNHYHVSQGNSLQLPVVGEQFRSLIFQVPVAACNSSGDAAPSLTARLVCLSCGLAPFSRRFQRAVWKNAERHTARNTCGTGTKLTDFDQEFRLLHLDACSPIELPIVCFMASANEALIADTSTHTVLHNCRPGSKAEFAAGSPEEVGTRDVSHVNN